MSGDMRGARRQTRPQGLAPHLAPQPEATPRSALLPAFAPARAFAVAQLLALLLALMPALPPAARAEPPPDPAPLPQPEGALSGAEVLALLPWAARLGLVADGAVGPAPRGTALSGLTLVQPGARRLEIRAATLSSGPEPGDLAFQAEDLALRSLIGATGEVDAQRLAMAWHPATATPFRACPESEALWLGAELAGLALRAAPVTAPRGLPAEAARREQIEVARLTLALAALAQGTGCARALDLGIEALSARDTRGQRARVDAAHVTLRHPGNTGRAEASLSLSGLALANAGGTPLLRVGQITLDAHAPGTALPELAALRSEGPSPAVRAALAAGLLAEIDAEATLRITAIGAEGTATRSARAGAGTGTDMHAAPAGGEIGVHLRAQGGAVWAEITADLAGIGQIALHLSGRVHGPGPARRAALRAGAAPGLADWPDLVVSTARLHLSGEGLARQLGKAANGPGREAALAQTLAGALGAAAPAPLERRFSARGEGVSLRPIALAFLASPASALAYLLGAP